jgi:hypothetical protein
VVLLHPTLTTEEIADLIERAGGRGRFEAEILHHGTVSAGVRGAPTPGRQWPKVCEEVWPLKAWAPGRLAKIPSAGVGSGFGYAADEGSSWLKFQMKRPINSVLAAGYEPDEEFGCNMVVLKNPNR